MDDHTDAQDVSRMSRPAYSNANFAYWEPKDYRMHVGVALGINIILMFALVWSMT